jgi:hypothetical protein
MVYCVKQSEYIVEYHLKTTRTHLRGNTPPPRKKSNQVDNSFNCASISCNWLYHFMKLSHEIQKLLLALNELYFWTLSIVWCLKKIEE